MSASIVGYLKMLVTLGTLRHSLAVDYDLQENVQRFVKRLARQQGLALLDPRRTFDRLYAGTGRVQRALQFLEFIEAQEPVITEATTMLFGYRNRMRRFKARFIRSMLNVSWHASIEYTLPRLTLDEDRREKVPMWAPISMITSSSTPASATRWPTSSTTSSSGPATPPS